jgi:hypothetical protein
MQDIWLELPIVIDGLDGANNDIIAALELNDRVSRITCLNLSSLGLERVVAVMQDPFPTLTDLSLWSSDGTAPVISDSWEDLLHVYDISGWTVFHFQHYRNYSHQPPTLSIFTSSIFRILDTFHPRRWPLASPR